MFKIVMKDFIFLNNSIRVCSLTHIDKQYKLSLNYILLILLSVNIFLFLCFYDCFMCFVKLSDRSYFRRLFRTV